jgi:uncharacterized membrane protein YkvA (DUF1232 family)
MENYVDFENLFKKSIQKHKSSKNYRYIQDYPTLFSTIVKIANDKNCEPAIRILMHCAISYFIIPKDVISEKEYGVKGYIDDIFVCIFALNEFIKYDKEFAEYLIKKYWLINEDYESYITRMYYTLLKEVEGLGKDVLNEIMVFSGLNKIREVLMAEKNGKNYYQKKIKDLETKLYYIFKLIMSNPPNTNEFKNAAASIFSTEEFRDFSRAMTLLAKHEKQYGIILDRINDVVELDELLKQKRIERLMK